MRKKNGQQVLLLIKDNADTKNIPVVMHSTGMAVTLKTKLMKAGAFDCFNKLWTNKEFNTQG
jgi:FixJ family two-component response regulator